jgi:hypothetical protein
MVIFHSYVKLPEGNVAKTMPFEPSPSHHHFNRRYEPFPVMGGKHGIVLPTLTKLNEDVGLCM